ncbi:MAG: hypothetical protein Q9160_006837 [Pyrenula sp. 1 TL-2023]
MDQTLKSRKEEFVSNLSGGDISEINLVTLVGPAAIILWSALQSRQSFFRPYGPKAMVTDFLLNVGMPLMAMTAYSSAPVLLVALLLTPVFFITITTHLIPQSKTKSASLKQKTSAQKGTPPPATDDAPMHRPFLTMYRGSMMIQTCLAILAVDFRVFPRRFAKVETWGTSLMDLGVGSFVFSAGVVSARSLLKSKSKSNSDPQQSHTSSSLLRHLPPSLLHSLPLLLLGVIRLLSVKGVDYAEHVTEYGVHWNFFFTLAFLGPFVELFDALTSYIPMMSYELLALILSVSYQILLDSTPLTRYILLSPRGPDLLSKNREGVFSFAGQTTNAPTPEPSQVSPLLHALNAHALPTFLAANLLTGLVNLSMNTLDAGFLGSMGVLVGYAVGVVGVAAGMERRGWKVTI